MNITSIGVSKKSYDKLYEYLFNIGTHDEAIIIVGDLEKDAIDQIELIASQKGNIFKSVNQKTLVDSGKIYLCLNAAFIYEAGHIVPYHNKDENTNNVEVFFYSLNKEDQIKKIYLDDDLKNIEVERQEKMDEIFHQIHNTYRINFSFYKKPTIHRRLDKRMQQMNISDIGEYLDVLKKDSNEAKELAESFLINVTQFFRDPEVFEIIQDQIFSDLIKKKKKEDCLRFWVAGCATGEEAYSMAISLEEFFLKKNIYFNYKIIASDINQNSIRTASSGIYSVEKLKTLSDDLIDRYFKKVGNKLQIQKKIRQNIVFAVHDAICEIPFIKMDMISCRNLLIYLKPSIQKKLLLSLHFSLNLNGYLILGPSETSSSVKGLFKTISKKWSIYENNVSSKILPEKFTSNYPIRKTKQLNSSIMDSNFKAYLSKHKSTDEFLNFIASEFVPICLFIDHNFEVIYVNGDVNPYLHIPQKLANLNLLNMMEKEERLVFRDGVRKVLKHNKAVHYKDISFKKNDKKFKLNVTFKPVKIPNIPKQLIFIQFVDSQNFNQEKLNEISEDNFQKESLRTLENEISELKKENQLLIDQLESSNEELQASNEELLAANEELQSTNEELQTVNDELSSVNHELKTKISELSIANSDMNNLIECTEIGTMFLDRELKIRKFTPPVCEHFNIKKGDTGRSINDFTCNLVNVNFRENADLVLNKLIPLEVEVKNNNGRVYLNRIIPYKTLDNVIDGVIVTFVDITKVKKIERELHENEKKYRKLYNATPAMLYSIDSKGKITTISDYCLKEMDYTREEVIGKNCWDFFTSDSKKLSKASIKECLSNGHCLDQPFQFVIKNGSIIDVLLSAVLDKKPDGSVDQIHIVITDITQRKQFEQDLRESKLRFQLAVEGAQHGIWDWPNMEEDKEWWSPKLYALLGYKNDEIPASFSNFESLIHPQDIHLSKTAIENHIKYDHPIDVEYRIQVKDGSYRWFRAKASVIKNKEGKAIRMSGSLSDIHNEKTALESLKQKAAQLSLANEAGKIGVWIWDITKDTLEWDERVYQNFNISNKVSPSYELFISRIHPEDVDEVKNSIEEALKKGNNYKVKYRLLWDDGSIHYNIAKGIIVKDNEKNSVGIVGICMDITDIKKAEQKLTNLNKELEQFSYVATHDLRAPSTNLKSLVELFKTKKLVNDHNQFIFSKIDQSVTQLYQTLEDLIEILFKKNVKDDKTEKISFKRAFENVLSKLQHEVNKVKPSIKTDFSNARKIQYYNTHLDSILFNLISNCLKFRSNDRPLEIQVKTEKTQSYVKLTVKDNGRGFDMSKKDKVFGIFKRLHDVEGKGVGLYIIKSLIESMEGRIDVNSKPNEGTEFIVYLKSNLI